MASLTSDNHIPEKNAQIADLRNELEHASLRSKDGQEL
jgi:hypothetical protein